MIAVGLMVDPLDSFNRVFMHQNKPKLEHIALIYIALAGYLVINPIIIIGYLLGDRLPKRTVIDPIYTSKQFSNITITTSITTE